MTHSRIGVTDQYAQSWGRIFFAIAPDAPGALLSYTAAGIYTVTDGLPNAPGEVYFQSFLFDQTANTYLYLSAQRSYRTGNESFTLGGSGGDDSNTFTGSLTGSLTAGHSYEWYYNAYTKTFGYPWGASATGNFSLTFNETTPPVAPVVPLPAAAWGGLALMGMLGAKRAVRRNREDAAV